MLPAQRIFLKIMIFEWLLWVNMISVDLRHSVWSVERLCSTFHFSSAQRIFLKIIIFKWLLWVNMISVDLRHSVWSVDRLYCTFHFSSWQQSSLGLVSDADTIRRNIVDDFSCEVMICWVMSDEHSVMTRAGCTGTTRMWPMTVSCSTCVTPWPTQTARRRWWNGASSAPTRRYSIRWGG